MKKEKWVLYLFGTTTENTGITWTPIDGYKPNVLVRWACRVFFDCRWVKRG